MIAPSLVLIAVDLAIAVLIVEAGVLFALRARHGLVGRDILLIALAGLGLLVAVRAALSGGPGLAVIAGLSLGGLAHGFDLVARLRGARSEAQKR